MYQSINNYCQQLEANFSSIDEKRKVLLESLSDYFYLKYQQQITPQAIVICTHNSRRSHLGQLWLAVGATYFNLPNIQTYSGGTEATAFNPRAVAALERVGFNIKNTTPKADNPIYHITWQTTQTPYQAFSKKYEDAPNPKSNFAAIMVCTDADEGCPFVAGTDFRLALPFDDPKAFDGTALESQKYDERCQQIGCEMFYVLKKVVEKLGIRD